MDSTPARSAVLGAYARRLITIKAKQLIRKSGFRDADRDDLEQELVLHLLKQADRFDPRRAGIRTFIDRVVDARVAEILRHRHRQKRAPGYTAQSLDANAADDLAGGSFISESITEADQRRRLGQSSCEAQEHQDNTMDVADAVAQLSPELRALCQHLMGGTSASVARDLGISRRQVRKGVERIREHFESLDLGDF